MIARSLVAMFPFLLEGQAVADCSNTPNRREGAS